MNTDEALDALTKQLAQHEGKSQQRYEKLCEKFQGQGKYAMDGVSDKVNINLGEGGGNGGMAAIIAALGNRNENNSLAPLMAAMGRKDDGFGGGGLMGGLLLGALLGGRGGLFGGNNGDDCDGDASRAAFQQSILNGIVGLTSAVPTTALETQNAILGALSAQSLSIQQGLSNVKDTVQNVGAINLQATNQVQSSVLTTGLQTQIAIGNDGDKTRALISAINDANLQRQLTVAQNALLEDRIDRRSRDVEVNVTQQVNQQQAQAQLQAQVSGLLTGFNALCAQVQNVRANQDIVNLGTMVASGAQTSTNTQVR